MNPQTDEKSGPRLSERSLELAEEERRRLEREAVRKMNSPLEVNAIPEGFALYEVRTPEMAQALVIADTPRAARNAACARADEFAKWKLPDEDNQAIEVFEIEVNLTEPGVIWWTP